MKKAAKIFLATLLAVTFLMAAAPVEAKKWTVTERLEKLSKEIDEGRKANELTVKQETSLKTMIADLKAKMEKMKAKNGGKLSVPDTKKLHDDMTDISVKTMKMRLDNVYSD